MTSFQDAPDEAIEADKAKEACSSLDILITRNQRVVKRRNKNEKCL